MGIVEREDKQKICDLLAPALRETRNLDDLDYLEYNQNRELVYAYFKNGCCKVADVAADSGTAMIQDIIKQII